MVTFWAILKSISSCKNCCGIYLGNIWAAFLLKYLIKLLKTVIIIIFKTVIIVVIIFTF